MSEEDKVDVESCSRRRRHQHHRSVEWVKNKAIEKTNIIMNNYHHRSVASWSIIERPNSLSREGWGIIVISLENVSDFRLVFLLWQRDDDAAVVFVACCLPINAIFAGRPLCTSNNNNNDKNQQLYNYQFQYIFMLNNNIEHRRVEVNEASNIKF